ncbi:MAG: PulJ/GspJ family protein [Planctomycetota bacterium]
MGAGRGPGAAGRSSRGFTLAEILVALSIFLVLGSMLVLALRSGVDTWRATEDRRQVYEQAQLILKQVENDLTNMAIPREGETGDVVVRLLCDLDANRRYRLRMVRTIKGEDEEANLRNSGTGPPDKYSDVLDGKGDLTQKLKPLGGVMEVAYVMDPDPTSNVLYRGVRSPIGGSGSLFVDGNIDDRKEVLERFTAVSEGVLFLGFRFWTQYTTTWKLQTTLSDNLDADCGPEMLWDSTRGNMPHPNEASKKNPNVFWMARGAGSLHDPSDDVFPRQVQVLVCVAAGGAAPHARLIENLDRKDRVIHVDAAGTFPTEDDPELFRYIKIGTEWIHFESRDAFSFQCTRKMRGARGTKPQSHEEGLLSRHAPEDPPWVERTKRQKPKKK